MKYYSWVSTKVTKNHWDVSELPSVLYFDVIWKVLCFKANEKPASMKTVAQQIS